jgi:hypothetical protein
MVTIDYEACRDWFELSEHIDNQIRDHAREFAIRRLEIEYEQLCDNPTSVLDFLGVARCPLSSQLRKQRKGSLPAIVSNYGELKLRFAGSRWSEYFVD